MEYPTPFQRRTLWNAATGVSILILGLLLVGLIWLTGRLFGFLQPVLIPVIVAGIIAYVLDPVVRLLQKRGFSRLWAITSIYLATLLGATLLLVSILPGIQRGHQSLKQMFNEDQERVVANASESIAQAPVQEEVTSMEASLVKKLRQLEADNPDTALSWLLVEIDDNGEAVRRTDTEISRRQIDSYANSRAGRFIYRYKDAIF